MKTKPKKEIAPEVTPTEKTSEKYMELAYPEDKRPKLEIESETLDRNVNRLEQLLSKARSKLLPVLTKEETSVHLSKYIEDPNEAVLTALLREKNIRLTNIATELEALLDRVQL